VGWLQQSSIKMIDFNLQSTVSRVVEAYKVYTNGGPVGFFEVIILHNMNVRMVFSEIAA